jgi:hypothetical protein
MGGHLTDQPWPVLGVAFAVLWPDNLRLLADSLSDPDHPLVSTAQESVAGAK